MSPIIRAVTPGRDIRLDSMRGLLLVCMTINHLPTQLRVFTDGPIGVFSAAEGFVFLSGLIAGMVYTRKLRTGGRAFLGSAARARSWTIYRWHLLSFVGTLAAVKLVEASCGYCSMTCPSLFFGSPLKALGLGALLLFQPGLLDLLPMYCVFLLLIPLVIPALESGSRGRIRVLACSAAVWLAVQWAPFPLVLPGSLNLGSFNVLAWQFLFIIGLVIGHARISGEKVLRRPPVVVMAGLAAVLAYGFGLHRLNWPELWPDSLFGILLNKPALGLYRLADFGCFAYVIAHAAVLFPRAFAWRPLAFLGQHSLQVVAAHCIGVLTILQFPALFSTPLLEAVTVTGAILLLFAAAACHKAYSRMGARRIESPVPLGALEEQRNAPAA